MDGRWRIYQHGLQHEFHYTTEQFLIPDLKQASRVILANQFRHSQRIARKSREVLSENVLGTEVGMPALRQAVHHVFRVLSRSASIRFKEVCRLGESTDGPEQDEGDLRQL